MLLALHLIHALLFPVRMNDAARLGTAHFMTEFGACAESPACAREIRRSTVAADAHLSSWAYWSYKYFNGMVQQWGQCMLLQLGDIWCDRVGLLSLYTSLIFSPVLL